MLRSFAITSIAPITAYNLGVVVLAVFSSCVIAAILVTSVAPEVKADVATTLHVPHSNGDRLSGVDKGADCSSLGWPHYEQTCQFDLRKPVIVPTVRIIALR
jgi:hypothetical protein